MKKGFLALLLIFAFSAAVYGGDLPEAIIGDLDCDVFIGTITEAENGHYTIEVAQALFDNYDVATVELPTFTYYGSEEGKNVPQVGDLCAVAARFIQGQWEVFDAYAPMAAKSDSLIPATLTLENPRETAFIQRMNEYINNGTYSAKRRAEISAEAAPETVAVSEAETTADSEAKAIAEETDLTALPPITQSEKPKGRIPGYIRYPILFLGPMAISYYFTKRNRKRDCGCQEDSNR